MASDEDNFDIDVYGDGEEDKTDQAVELSAHELPADGVDDGVGQSVGQGADYKSNGDDVGSKPQPTDKQIANVENANDGVLGGTGHVGAQSAAAEIKRESPEHVKPGQLATPKTDPPKQGIKRKESPDDRPIDSGATSALVVTDLNWWNTDDELRGWTKKAECEQELKDVTFSEHKVNGKSKGQAYLEFVTPQAATAAKRKIEALAEDQQSKKFPVSFASSSVNPYRTLPKDAPVRGKDGQRNQDHRAAPGGHIGPGWAGHNPNHVVPGAGMHSYRGGRGNFNHRGGRGNNNNNVGAFQHRNFPGPMVAAPAVNFQGAPMTAYPGGMVGGVNPYGYPNRGAMMGAMRTGPMAGRGGRGGMAPNGMMGGMANMGAGPGMMGGMAGPMGGVAPPMAMAHIGPQGQPGYQSPHPQPHYNPAFFGQSQVQAQAQPASVGGDGSWNPHGTKRARPE